jgi:hypothetical protein
VLALVASPLLLLHSSRNVLRKMFVARLLGSSRLWLLSASCCLIGSTVRLLSFRLLCLQLRNCDFDSVGASLHLAHSINVWRVPLGFQLVPAGIMAIGLFTVKVSDLFFSILTPESHVHVGISAMVGFQRPYSRSLD